MSALIEKVNTFKQDQLLKIDAKVKRLVSRGISKEDLESINTLQQVISNLKEHQIGTITFSTLDLDNGYRSERDIILNQKLELKEKLDADKLALTSKVESVNLIKQQEYEDKLAPIVIKHKQLLQYKEKLQQVAAQYSLNVQTSTDIARLSEAEALSLMDQCLLLCKQLDNNKSAKLLSKIEDIRTAKWETQLFALIGGFLALTLLSPLLLIAFIAYRIYSIVYWNKQLDNVLLSLNLISLTEIPIDDIQCEEKENVDYSALEAEYEKQMQELDEELETLELAYNANLNDYNLEVQEIAPKYTAVLQYLEEYRQTKIKEVEANIVEIQKEIDERKANAKQLGQLYNPGLVFDNTMCFSVDECGLDLFAKYSLSNFVYNPESPGMLNYLRLLALNILFSVQPEYAIIHICDPNGLGTDFADFFAKELNKVCIVHTDNNEEVIKQMREYIAENIRLFKDDDIQTYNTKCQEMGKLTREYHFVFLLSNTGSLLNSTSFQELMSYSTKYGVYLFTAFTPADKVNIKPIDTPTYVNKQYSGELLMKSLETYATAKEKCKPPATIYNSMIRDRFIPREKYWTWDSTAGLELNFGLQDGDPDKMYPIIMSDNNVHCLMAGRTGSGKSVAINQMLLSLLYKYSPKELELIMVDFKNVEFSTYTKDGISRIPHAKVIAGTKDGEYAVSIFTYLQGEMMRRTKLFAEYGEKNIKDFNKKVVSMGKPELKVPRILCIIDEFQVMFTEVEPKCVDKIKQLIQSLAKLARFCGTHLWFTSQSMTGTLSNDVLNQFQVRAALKCTSDTSSQVIGNPASAKIKADRGYLHTNLDVEAGESANVLWKVPLAPTPEIMECLDIMEELSKEKGIPGHKAVFYDEEKLHPDTDLIKVLENVTNPPKGLLVLGERTEYSLNKAPTNFCLQKDVQQNILIFADDKSDLLNLTFTVVDNMKYLGYKYFLNVADRDNHSLLDADTLVEPELAPITDPDFDSDNILKMVEGEVTEREQDPEGEHTPLYLVLVNWERLTNMNHENGDYRWQNNLSDLLKRAPKYDIHFIFIMKSAYGLMGPLFPNCVHKIGAKVDDRTEGKISDTFRSEKLPEHFAVYATGGNSTKFKIYQHTFTKTLGDKELVI